MTAPSRRGLAAFVAALVLVGVVGALALSAPDPCVATPGDASSECLLDGSESAWPPEVSAATQTLSTTPPTTTPLVKSSTATPTTPTSSTQPAPTTPTTSIETAPKAGTWLSGASGTGVASGQFGSWRGTPTPIAATWSDNSARNQVGSTQFNPGAEYDAWTGSIDWSMGAIYSGESWEDAATGAYDARWSQALTNIKAKWSNKARGTMFIRFAHEMNYGGYIHAVHTEDIESFKATWIRLYNLKQKIFPAAQLTFNTNANTSGSDMNYDWRTLWPGDAYVDVYSVDYYSNHWLDGGIDGVDSHGAPYGIEQHRQFALAHGKPMGVSEWGPNSGDGGDQPDYIRAMFDQFKAHAGPGPGQYLFECLFNVTGNNNNKFGVYPTSKSPKSQIKYRDLF